MKRSESINRIWREEDAHIHQFVEREIGRLKELGEEDGEGDDEEEEEIIAVAALVLLLSEVRE